MALQLGTLTCVEVGVSLGLLGCLGGCGGSGSGDDCLGHCEPSRGTGPAIAVTPDSALIAVVETTAGESWPDSGVPGTCAVVDSWGSTLTADRACPASSLDGGVMTDSCTTRYICGAQNTADREGGGCRQVWLNMGSDTCSVTVVAVTGERRAVDVRLFFTGLHQTCRAGCGGPWIDQALFATDPSEIIVTFARPDGGPVSDADDAACGLSADGSAICWDDDSAGQSTAPAGI